MTGRDSAATLAVVGSLRAAILFGTTGVALGLLLLALTLVLLARAGI